MVKIPAYKLRLARQPAEESELEGDLRYFVRYLPPDPRPGTEAHATEA